VEKKNPDGTHRGFSLMTSEKSFSYFFFLTAFFTTFFAGAFFLVATVIPPFINGFSAAICSLERILNGKRLMSIAKIVFDLLTEDSASAYLISCFRVIHQNLDMRVQHTIPIK
jgi:hypothetical protein